MPGPHAMRRLSHIHLSAYHVGKEDGTIASCCQQCGRWACVGGEPPTEPKALGLNHFVTEITGTLRGVPQTASEDTVRVEP